MMNLARVNDGVVRNGTPLGAEVAYVRRDSFWIEHEDRLDGAAQSTAPIFVEDVNHGVERSEPAEDGPWMADEPEIPARAWRTLPALRVLALTALAFALGIAVSPLVRWSRPPAPAAVIATPTPSAAPVASTVAVSPEPPSAVPAINDADSVAMAPPVAHASARTSAHSFARSRSTSERKNSKSLAAPETTASSDDAGLSTAKPSDKPPEIAPSKTKESSGSSTAPKKPAAKPWVDPWAGDFPAARAG